MITIFGFPTETNSREKSEILNHTTFAFIKGDIFYQGEKLVPPPEYSLRASVFVLTNLPQIVHISQHESEGVYAYELSNLDEFLALTILANKQKILDEIPNYEVFQKILNKLMSPDFKVAKIFANDDMIPEKKIKKACKWLLK